MANAIIDGVELITRPITLGVLNCGDHFTATGHIEKGAAVECPEHCTAWEVMGTTASEVLHTYVAENITII